MNKLQNLVQVHECNSHQFTSLVAETSFFPSYSFSCWTALRNEQPSISCFSNYFSRVKIGRTITDPETSNLLIHQISECSKLKTISVCPPTCILIYRVHHEKNLKATLFKLFQERWVLNCLAWLPCNIINISLSILHASYIVLQRSDILSRLCWLIPQQIWNTPPYNVGINLLANVKESAQSQLLDANIP